MTQRAFTHDDYNVGWVCPLSTELTAAMIMLDERHPDLPKPPNDPNTYTLGSIGKHRIVLAALPLGKIGNNLAASIANQMIHTFPSIRVGLLVGIGGGIPSKVNLGDVVVSIPVGKYPGVVQWDFGKTEDGGKFMEKGALDSPPNTLLTAASTMKAESRICGGYKLGECLEEVSRKLPNLSPSYTRPPSSEDEPQKAQPGKNHRPSRNIEVHEGLIASGNQVIKDARTRDAIDRNFDGRVLCIEMEAAGMKSAFPCIVIRGICDYADAQKNDNWQNYAAAVAAAYAKKLLGYVQPTEVDGERPVRDILSHVEGSVEPIRVKLHRKEDLGILHWLTDVDYETRHSDVFSSRQEGTGKWFLKSNEYQTWLHEVRRSLFCPGIPGAGKTVLTSIIVDDLLRRFRTDSTIGIAFIYNEFSRQEDQSAAKLLASLIKQLAETRPSLPECVKELYDESKKLRRQPLLTELSDTLHSLAATYSRVFIVVDALDECPVSGGARSKFMSEMFSLQRDSMCRANILATSRDLPDIAEMFHDDTTNANNAILPIHAREEDVWAYLDCRMRKDQLPDFVHENLDLQAEIKDGIVKFLLAQLHFNSVIGKNSPKTTRTALEHLPTGSDAYHKIYDSIMERIKQQDENDKSLAQDVLSWLTCAKRPLSTTELQHALAVEIMESELHRDNLPPIQKMVSVCAGLVTIDKNSSIIRLVHYTTQVYLQETQSSWFPYANIDITKACVTYLSFNTFGSGPCRTAEDFQNRLESNPLYDYAARNWGLHARDCSPCPTDVIRFLEKSAQVEASGQVVTALGPSFHWQPVNQMTRLHLVAYFGLEEPFRTLHQTGTANAMTSNPVLESHAVVSDGHPIIGLPPYRGFTLEDRDIHGWTPLCWAARRGHAAVAKLMIEKGANPRVHTSNGWTPLTLALLDGHAAVARLLLATGKVDNHLDHTALLDAVGVGHEAAAEVLMDHGMYIEARDFLGRTPLLRATAASHESMVKMLVAKGANISAEDNAGITPLKLAMARRSEEIALFLVSKGANEGTKQKYPRDMFTWASLNGFEKSVKLLLKDGIEPNSTGDSEDKKPALLLAARGGHEEVVKILLEAGANPKLEDILGNTPLSEAARNGHHRVVHLLSMRGGNVNSRDTLIRTPLILAACNGHEAVVSLLLESGADMNICDRKRRTPLLNAVRYGHETVTKLLLGRGADINSPDETGMTPLLCAVEKLDEAMVALLLGHDADANCRNSDGRVPLWEASRRGHEEIVKLLLKSHADVNFADINGDTPLSMAVKGGHTTVAKLLLENGAAIDSKRGGTILPWAVKCGDPKIVRLILDNGIAVDSTNTKYGRTLLCWAARQGNIAVIKLLLSKQAGIDIADGDGQTPLSLAVDGDHTAVVELLLAHGAKVDPRDSGGQTPLSRAAKGGCAAVIELLLAHNANANLADNDGQTPMFHAANHGHEAVVRMLLSHGAAAESTGDMESPPPLLTAALNGHEGVVKLLLEHGVEVDPKNDMDRTPLALAVWGRHERVVNLLLTRHTDVNSKDIYGRTPLFWGVYSGNIGIVTALLARQADVSCEDTYGGTALACAVEKGQEAITSLLIEHGAITDVDLKGEYGGTLLVKAAAQGHGTVVRLLLEKGACVDSIDNHCRSALWHAAEGGHAAVVQILLIYGADVNLADIDERTPQFRAAANGHAAVVELLAGRLDG